MFRKYCRNILEHDSSFAVFDPLSLFNSKFKTRYNLATQTLCTLITKCERSYYAILPSYWVNCERLSQVPVIQYMCYLINKGRNVYNVLFLLHQVVVVRKHLWIHKVVKHVTTSSYLNCRSIRTVWYREQSIYIAWVGERSRGHYSRCYMT